MWRFSIATKQQIVGFPTISDKVIFPTVVKPLISNKNVQNRPESEQFGRCWAFFYALLADNLREHKSTSLRPFATCLAPIQTVCYNV